MAAVVINQTFNRKLIVVDLLGSMSISGSLSIWANVVTAALNNPSLRRLIEANPDHFTNVSDGAETDHRFFLVQTSSCVNRKSLVLVLYKLSSYKL